MTMMMRVVAFLMVWPMFMAGAFANTNSKLKAAFDELHYSLQIEWDQKDKNFYEAKRSQFENSVKELMKEGLSYQDYVQYLKSELKNNKVAIDLEQLINHVSFSNMSSQEANEYIMQVMQNSYSRGASWNPDGIQIFGIVCFAAIIVALVIGSKQYCRDFPNQCV